MSAVFSDDEDEEPGEEQGAAGVQEVQSHAVPDDQGEGASLGKRPTRVSCTSACG